MLDLLWELARFIYYQTNEESILAGIGLASAGALSRLEIRISQRVLAPGSGRKNRTLVRSG